MTRHSSTALLSAVRSSRTACCLSPGGELLHILSREKLQELRRGYSELLERRSGVYSRRQLGQTLNLWWEQRLGQCPVGIDPSGPEHSGVVGVRSVDVVRCAQ